MKIFAFKKILLFGLIILLAVFVISRNVDGPSLDDKNGTESPTKTQSAGKVPATSDGSAKTLFGMIPSSPDPKIALSLIQSGKGFSEPANNGAQIMYWYIEWKDLADDWKTADIIMPKLAQAGKTAVVVSVINTTVLSEYPKGYKTFTEKGFAEAFAAFVGEFAGRYKPEYIFIGNEANTYLATHKSEVAAYENILKLSNDAIKQASEKTKVGVSVAYRDGIGDNFALIKKLAGHVDVIGYTVYAFKDPEFQFGEPKEGIDMLKKLTNAVPGKPYAVIETGWNSSPLLGSSDTEQAEFARLLLDYIPASDAEFINWFILQDGKDCSAPARAFLPPGANPEGRQFEIFKEFLCKFGAKNADGSDKESWKVLKERL